MKFAFSIFDVEFGDNSARIALLELACLKRCGALVALEVESINGGLEVSGDFCWISFFSFTHE